MTNEKEETTIALELLNQARDIVTLQKELRAVGQQSAQNSFLLSQIKGLVETLAKHHAEEMAKAKAAEVTAITETPQAA
jgi:hypothetical protein